MCFSLEASIAAALTALITGVVSFFVLKSYESVVAYAILCWGFYISLMQIAEAFMWWTYPSKEGCLASTKFGYIANISQPIAVLVFTTLITNGWRRKVSFFTLLVYTVFAIYNSIEAIPDTCVSLTEKGHLSQPYWNNLNMAFYFVSFTIGLLLAPPIVRWPFLFLFYGTYFLSKAFYNPQAVGTVWCIGAALSTFLIAFCYYVYFKFIRKN